MLGQCHKVTKCTDTLKDINIWKNKNQKLHHKNYDENYLIKINKSHAMVRCQTVACKIATFQEKKKTDYFEK